MPDQPKTPMMSFRAPADLREAVKVKAQERGETITDVLIRAMKRYVR